jgi:transglutaminase-like putative cysteine protease
MPATDQQPSLAENQENYLAPTYFLDGDHPHVAAFAASATANAADERERAIKLFYAVRDGVRYDPYSIRLEPEFMRASAALKAGRAFCVPKAVLLAAAGRAVGLASRLGFADVRNHLATRRLLDLMGTDVFAYHGYAEVRLDGRWIKLTPAFNIELCQKFRVRPIDFDGVNDAMLQAFDADNRRHMEYVNDRGAFADLPFAELREALLRLYPNLFRTDGRLKGDFAAEAEAEQDRA